MRIVSPAGIGDWSWLYSKLYSVRHEITEWGIVDGWPYRTREFVELADPGKPTTYDTNVTYPMMLQFEHLHRLNYQARPTWSQVRDLGLLSANVLLEANQHLEHGLPLSEWLPDLPTKYHYPLPVSEPERALAHKKLARALAAHPMTEGPIVAISCASYRGSEAWKTWRADDWILFLQQVMKLGWRPLLMGGSWDDLTYTVACELELLDLVGKTNVPQMVEILNQADSYIGFSSGMNVIRTVLDKPAMALWPDHQQELSRSWAPPAMLESGRYVASPWRPVSEVLPVARAFLRRCAAEVDTTPRPWTNGNGAAEVLGD